MRAFAFLLVAGLALGFVLDVLAPRASADPSSPEGLANDTHNNYRIPWPERQTHAVDGGCQNGGTCEGVWDEWCQGGHTGSNEYAIDFGTRYCGARIRADSLGGVTVHYDDRYGWLFLLKHPDGQGSWFAHLPSGEPWDTVFAQGDYISDAGDTGYGTGCHLHYQVNNNHALPGEAHTALNALLSGTLFISHLSIQYNTAHPSNNTGPGYGRPYYGSCSDPLFEPGRLCYDAGPENAPKSSSIRTWARNYAAYTGDVGSTRAAIQGPCGANRRWVKSCSFGYSGVGFTQSFVVSGYGLQIPVSLTEGPDGNAYTVKGAMWKAYGRKCSAPWAWVYEIIGKPTGEEHDWGTYWSEQHFQYGHLRAYRNPNDPLNVYVYVYDNSWNHLCTLGVPGGGSAGGFYDWLDLEHEPCYDVTGDGIVNSSDFLIMAWHKRTSETNPINTKFPGYDYDDRYDLNRDGVINSGDMYLVGGQVGEHRCCK
jgi:hypothetical protein